MTGPQGDYKPQLLAHNFNQLIYQQDDTDKCDTTGFMSAKLSGTFSSAIRWGFTMVGTISPSLSFQEAYGFFDSDMDLSGEFMFDGSGEWNIAGSTKPADLFPSDISDYGFSHPGYASALPHPMPCRRLPGAHPADGRGCA